VISTRFTRRAAALGILLGISGAFAWGCSTGFVGPPSNNHPPRDAGPPSNHALKFSGTDFGQAGTANFVSSSSPQTVSSWVWVLPDDAGADDAGAEDTGAAEARAADAGSAIMGAAKEQDFISLQRDIQSGLRLGIKGEEPGAWPASVHTGPLVESKVPLPPGWHHVAYVLDRSDGGFLNTLYVDGEMRGVTTSKPDNLTPTQVLLGTSEGAGVPQYANYFAGYLDEIRIWIVARTAAEVQQEMSGNVGPIEPGLVAYFNCDEILDGGLLLDNSDNGNNAVLGGGDPNYMPTLVPSDR
jgi:hypothetical protein